MIKQIQLRGISHRPSDKLTQDGGLEECIDLRLDNQELGPAKDAVNVTDELAPGLSTSGIEVMYIHNGNGYTNYVGLDTRNNSCKLAAYVYDPDDQNANTSGWVYKTICNFYPDIDSITSVGNMLMVTVPSQGRTFYALFKDRSYKYLASKVPRPSVRFNTQLSAITPYVTILDCNDVTIDCMNESGTAQVPTAKELWDYTLRKRFSEGDEGLHASTFFRNVQETFWEKINKERIVERGDGKFTAPVLARYALKLFDGSYIYVSDPIILSSGHHSHVLPFVCNLGVADSRGRFAMTIGVQDVFSVGVSAWFDNVYTTDWDEIISSVDVFLSNDILVPKINSEPASADQLTSRMVVSGLTISTDDIEIKFNGATGSIKEAFEARYTEAANFYLAASYDIKNLPNNRPLSPYEQDELVVRQRLTEGYSQDFSPFGELSSYNNRLVSVSQRVTLSPGGYFQAFVPTTPESSVMFSLFYHVRDSYGNERIVRGVQGSVFPETIRAYIAYPDPKCFQADLYVGAVDPYTHQIVYTTKVILPMKEHPRLNCSYGFWGLDERLDTPVAGDGRSSETAGDLPTENPTYFQYDRLMLSEMDNPFVFPLGQRQRFADRIIGALPATIALSTGQFGQFPLYVFTEGGIWTISLDDEGKMAASHPVSRDVALEGTIAQLDQAIVFVSNQGVMILQGSQISCLSPYMDGPQYTINDIAPAGSALRASLTADGYGSLLGLSLDTTSFKNFLNGCKPLYDYENRRILLFNPNKGYAYECDLESQTWRKHSLPDTFTRVLNGYPSAYSYMNGKIYEWSVRPNFNEPNPTARKGWLLTRPFDLDAPDIRKSLNSIRIRGVYNHADVKYILLGSMNGIQWQRLTSLRGGSYKSFRLLILTNFTTGEKLSWIDIDFETRFGNKLR
jgi:hypothetical protein